MSEYRDTKRLRTIAHNVRTPTNTRGALLAAAEIERLRAAAHDVVDNWTGDRPLPVGDGIANLAMVLRSATTCEPTK